MNRQIVPVNVLKSLGISKEQYAKMSAGEVMELVRLCYASQANTQSNVTK